MFILVSRKTAKVMILSLLLYGMTRLEYRISDQLDMNLFWSIGYLKRSCTNQSSFCLRHGHTLFGEEIFVFFANHRYLEE